TRHTHASMLLESGVSMKEVQERLRHSSIKLTMDTYAHLTKETKEKTVEKLAEHLNF
ncbi:tyrosine-type recombinase/integrase, partial [Enterococcus faecium]|nr:tyrosine-type recombinase/integrase [Enterococcus faecium]